MVAPDERERIVHTWNDTDVDYPHDICVHELFETQAARTPTPTPSPTAPPS